MIDRDLYKSYLFFKEWAGYSTPPGRSACALELAKAERFAWREGLRYFWREGDEYLDYQDMLGDHEYWCKDAKRERAGYSDDGVQYPRNCLHHEHEIETCYLAAPSDQDDWVTDPDHPIKVLASLCGIIDPSQEYRRVVEAELALEIMRERKEGI